MPYNPEQFKDPETGLYSLPEYHGEGCTRPPGECAYETRQDRATAVFFMLAKALPYLTIPILNCHIHRDPAADILWHDLNVYLTSVIQYAEGAGVPLNYLDGTGDGTGYAQEGP